MARFDVQVLIFFLSKRCQTRRQMLVSGDDASPASDAMARAQPKAPLSLPSTTFLLLSSFLLALNSVDVCVCVCMRGEERGWRWWWWMLQRFTIKIDLNNSNALLFRNEEEEERKKERHG